MKELVEYNKQLKVGINKSEIPLKNAMLLEGPSGVGKTTLAKAIADQSGCKYLRILGANIPDRHIGGTKDNVNNPVKAAIAAAEADKTCVVIFVDEVHSLSSHNDSTAHNEYQNAYIALYDLAEKNSKNPHVFFIFATNYIDELPCQLKSRLNSRTIHMKTPDPEQRKELIEHFSRQFTKKELAEYCPNDCVKRIIEETKTLSIRNLEDLFSYTKEYVEITEEPIDQNHLMQGLEKTKLDVAHENALSKQERERAEAIAREKEHLDIARANHRLNEENNQIAKIGIIMTILGNLPSLSPIPVPKPTVPWWK